MNKDYKKLEEQQKKIADLQDKFNETYNINDGDYEEKLKDFLRENGIEIE